MTGLALGDDVEGSFAGVEFWAIRIAGSACVAICSGRFARSQPLHATNEKKQPNVSHCRQQRTKLAGAALAFVDGVGVMSRTDAKKGVRSCFDLETQYVNECKNICFESVDLIVSTFVTIS